jgi:hypothetical protein
MNQFAIANETNDLKVHVKVLAGVLTYKERNELDRPSARCLDSKRVAIQSGKLILTAIDFLIAIVLYCH